MQSCKFSEEAGTAVYNGEGNSSCKSEEGGEEEDLSPGDGLAGDVEVALLPVAAAEHACIGALPLLV